MHCLSDGFMLFMSDMSQFLFVSQLESYGIVV